MNEKGFLSSIVNTKQLMWPPIKRACICYMQAQNIIFFQQLAGIFWFLHITGNRQNSLGRFSISCDRNRFGLLT